MAETAKQRVRGAMRLEPGGLPAHQQGLYNTKNFLQIYDRCQYFILYNYCTISYTKQVSYVARASKVARAVLNLKDAERQ